MDGRSHAGPMDWEYHHGGPMDPSSPFTQSIKRAQERNPFGDAPSGFSAFAQTGPSRTQMTPSKPLPPTPSIFLSSRAQSSTTAPPFRNPAFTTPRKPFDVDELSGVESSPAATDASDCPETPDLDQSPSRYRSQSQSLGLSQMTITPASMHKRGQLFSKKMSGKGEVSKPVFPMRDKVRKRRRQNGDKDISGYRLPYIHSGEGDDSDYESDDSTFQPKRSRSRGGKRGWFRSTLSSLNRYPHLPRILGSWLNLACSLASVTGTSWVLWTIVASLKEDFTAAQRLVRDELLDESSRCQSQYIANKCHPLESRLPALHQFCETWYTCMNRDPGHINKVQLGAKGIVEIINEIVDSMSYKTIGILLLLVTLFLFSGRSLYKTASDLSGFTGHQAPVYTQPPSSEHVAPPQVYWQAIQPQTPRYNLHRLPHNDETPETDTSPSVFKTLLPPETPTARRSPSKVERGRSPTKSRSPTKLY
ncbi:hypothetical protein F5Y10DRAFT_249725 [Nemania abortiva]|nr:hypothetical protein F5Y10DRAFT_249725 [Nemania abortiva]